jgi:hypothetical protein
MKLLTRIRQEWKRLWRRKRLKRALFVESMNDVPDDAGSALYVVLRSGRYRRAVLQCPCKCGKRIDINLAEERDPHWTVDRKGSVVSLAPSIWVSLQECGSHFFVRQNRIEWCEEGRMS